MGRGVNGALLKLMRATDYEVELVKAWWLSPTMRALRFTSPQLFADKQMEDGEYLRFWFSNLNNPKRQDQRGYTLVNIDREAKTFDVYVLIHEPPGPASTWSLHAEPGETLEVTRLGSAPFQVAPETTQGVVFFVDAASFPHVASVLHKIPDDLKILVIAQLYHESDKTIPLVDQIQADPRVAFEWIAPDFEAMESCLKSHDFNGWNAHILNDTKTVAQVRKHLLKVVGLPKALVHPHAYWVKGRAMGTKRDVAEAS